MLGAGKTATTSLCGLLNSHPDVFSMCEVFLNNAHISRYGRKLLDKHPDLLPCFIRPYGADTMENYRRAHARLRSLGYAKSYFGDKFVGIDSGYAHEYKDVRVVYSVRRVAEWIAKDSVRGWFPIELDVVPFAVQYAKHFIESFALPKVYHVRMERFLGDNAAVVREIWSFLGLEPPPMAEQWWETIGRYPVGDPKAALNWWRGHASSAVPPQENDTRIELLHNAFWGEFLPVFNKYYDAPGDHRFALAEVEQDLATLQSMVGRHRQSFESCYVVADSQSHNPRAKSERRFRRSRIGRLLTAMRLH